MKNKKSFKENPALQFISTTKSKIYTENTQYTDNTGNAGNTQNTYTLNTEVKSKRLNLLLKPSLFEKISKIATVDRTSVNDIVNRALEQYAQQKSDAIERYNSFYENEK